MKPLHLKRNIEIRWLSLFQSILRDVELQQSIEEEFKVNSVLYKSVATRDGKATVLKLAPKPNDYILLRDLLGVLTEAHNCSLRLQRSHVTLAEAEREVKRLTTLLKSNSLYEYKCPNVKSDASKKTRVVEYDLKKYSQLHISIQGFCDLLLAALAVRFPTWLGSGALLCAVTDVRFSTFERFVNTERQQTTMRNVALKLLREKLEELYRHKLHPTVEIEERLAREKRAKEEAERAKANNAPQLARPNFKIMEQDAMSPTKASCSSKPQLPDYLNSHAVDLKVRAAELAKQEIRFLNEQTLFFFKNEETIKAWSEETLSLDDVLKFMKSIRLKVPMIFDVFCSYNLVSATTCNAERLFSQCGAIETKRNKGTVSSLVNNARAYLKSNIPRLNNLELKDLAKRAACLIEYLDKRKTEQTRKYKRFDKVRGVKVPEGWLKRLNIFNEED